MSDQADGDLEAEADAELKRLTVDAEPVPLEQQMKEDNERRREAFQEWRQLIEEDDG